MTVNELIERLETERGAGRGGHKVLLDFGDWSQFPLLESIDRHDHEPQVVWLSSKVAMW